MHRIALRWQLTAGLVAGLLLMGCGSEPAPETRPSPTNRLPEGSDAALAPLRQAIEDGDALSRAARLASLLPTLPFELAEAVRDVVIKDDETAIVEFALVGSWWGRHDGPAAFRWARAVIQDFRTGVMMAVLRSWAEHDPTAAAVEVHALSGPPQWACQSALIRGWYASKQPGLVDYIRDLGQGSYRQLSLSVYSETLHAHEGSGALIAWVDGLPDDPDRFRYAAQRQAVYVLAGLDREAAIEWADRERGEAMQRLVAARWAGEDGPAAMNWAASIEDPKVRRKAVRMAYRHWLLEDRLEAVDWALGLDPENPGDLASAAGAIAMSISWKEPVTALRWIDHLEDLEERDRAQITVLRRWRKRNAAEAEAWLERSDYSEDKKLRILTDSLEGVGAMPRDPQ